jgi:hypothetical protein
MLDPCGFTDRWLFKNRRGKRKDGAPGRSTARTHPAPGYSSGDAMQAIAEVSDSLLPRDMSYAWNG